MKRYAQGEKNKPNENQWTYINIKHIDFKFKKIVRNSSYVINKNLD